MCRYVKEYGDAPCCTHECNGCMWHEEDEEEVYDLEVNYTTTNNAKELIPRKTNKDSNIEMEVHGVASLESTDGRPYSMSNVCDFVSILVVNGYAVLIESPSAQEYIVTYGYVKGDCYERP